MNRPTFIFIIMTLFSLLISCHSFNSEEAQTLLNKDSLTSQDYDRLIDLYEDAMGDVTKKAGKEVKAHGMKPEVQQEAVVMFEISGRLSRDENLLSDSQKRRIAQITSEGEKKMEKNGSQTKH